MKTPLLPLIAASILTLSGTSLGADLQTDVIPTSRGDLKITFVGHGSLMFEFEGKVIHVDPFGRLTDYGALPKADLILITHEHADHLDPDALKRIRKSDSPLILTEVCANRVPGGTVMKNGDTLTLLGLPVDALPAYNIVNKRGSGQPYHPKGQGNGYVIHFGDKRVYIAGDTENTPEMKALKDIHVAFLPMNLPYTMTPEMAADAAKAMRPTLLYPYHFGETDTSQLVDLLKNEADIEVRIRDLK